MKHKFTPLEPDCVYHIYNGTNGNERLFMNDENYRFFLNKYKQYISPVVDTFCYCLMRNHFHILVRVKDLEELRRFLIEKNRMAKKEDLQGFENLEGLVGQQFSNFFNAYAKAFNKQQNRRGSLFMHTYNRIRVSDDQYFRKLVHYIHYNPVEAKYCNSPGDWKFSSYNSLISTSPTSLLREELLSYFQDRENFIYCHQTPPGESGIEGDF